MLHAVVKKNPIKQNMKHGIKMQIKITYRLEISSHRFHT